LAGNTETGEANAHCRAEARWKYGMLTSVGWKRKVAHKKTIEMSGRKDEGMNVDE
jgi:hypothetical protein